MARFAAWMLVVVVFTVPLVVLLPTFVLSQGGWLGVKAQGQYCC
jgi:hypothetical protein